MLDRDTCIANCQHKFYLHCILGWYEKPINIGDNTCPECRGDIRLRRLDEPVVETAEDIRRLHHAEAVEALRLVRSRRRERERSSINRAVEALSLSRGRTVQEIREELFGAEEALRLSRE